MATIKVGDSFTIFSLGILRGIGSTPASGTTQTLEEHYWYKRGKREYEVRTLHADTVERWYYVPIKEYDNLKPSIADTYYGDSYQIVANVRRQDAKESNNCWMIVTYLKLTNKGWSAGYAETRRRRLNGRHTTDYEIYGIATSISQTGIPAKGDYLDIDDWDVGHGTYSTGDYVVNGSQLYICVSDHTAAADKEPGNTDDGTYWKPSIEAPICLEVERDDKVYPGLILIRSRWSQYLRYSTGHNAAIADFELIRQSRSQRWRGKNYRGLRRFLIPNSLVDTYRDDFKPDDGNVWPGTASTWDVGHGTYDVDDLVQGDGSPNSYIYKCTVQHTAAADKEPPNASYWSRVRFAAYVHEHNEEREAVPNHTVVTSYYYRPTKERLLFDNAGNGTSTGKAILEVHGNGHLVEWKYDKDNKVISGPDTTDSEKRWIVVKGTAVQWLTECTMRVTTVATQQPTETLLTYLGHYNDAGLPNFGNAGADTMFLFDIKTKSYLVEDERYMIEYYFRYNPNKWTDKVTVQKQQRQVQTVNGKDVVVWKNDGASQTRTLASGSKDFSGLNGMLSWDT